MQQSILQALEYIQSFGNLGMLLFVVLYVLATIAFIPGSLLTLGAGAVYGLGLGTLLVSVSSVLGASAAFLLARFLLRNWVSRKISEQDKFRAIDQAVAEEGWRIVLLTRLSPAFPFVFLNYAFGLTKVSFRQYALASWIGMLPGTLLYVYLGAVAGSVATLGAPKGSHEKGTLEWVVTVLGLLATLLVTIVITNIARRALKQKQLS